MSEPEIFSHEVSCDWYDAGVPDGDFKAIIDGLSATLGAQPRRVDGKHGYDTAVQLFATGEGVQEARALVLTDNPRSPGRVFVSANGQSGGPARRFLLDQGITHLVNRYDAAVDLRMSDIAFRKRSNKMINLCREQKKAHHPMGTVEAGQTLYCNWRVKTALTSKNQKQPEAQVVFYEKGKQKGLADHLDWKRVELRLRPQKEDAKAAATLIEPSDLWGVFKWTASMLEIATGGERAAGDVAYPRFQMTLPEVAEEMRKIRAMQTLKHLSSQYGRTYDTLVEICGEEEADRLVLAAFKRERAPQQDPAEMYQDLYRPSTQH